MRKLLQLHLAKMLFIAAMVTGANSWGQVTMQTTGNYTQDFNTLATSGTNTFNITHWLSQRTGSGTTYTADAGSGNAGGLYSYGTGTNSDRALGTLGSGNAAAGSFAHGVQLKNTSGTTITDIKVTYSLEQWRNGGGQQNNPITVWYRKSTSAITALTPNVSTGWTQITALTLNTPVNTGSSSAALNGNNNKNTATSVSIPNLSLANDEFIMIKWEDPDHSGTDHGTAIDDVTIAWTVSPTAPTVITNLATDISASGATLNGTANANGTGTINLNFEYGTTTGYGSAPSSVSPATATASSNTNFSGAITGLLPNTTYNFRAKGGSVDGSNTTFVTLANTPGAPLVDGATVNSLTVTIDAVTQNNNPAATQYAIRENGGQYVQSGGSLGASAVWQTASQWGAKVVTGLSANTSYSFQTKARNNATTQVETAFSSLAAGTTLANTSPTLSATALATFGSVCLNESVTNSFQLLGENLDATAVTVGSREGFTFSATSGGEYTTTLTLYADAEGDIISDVFVRFTPTAAQTYSANIPVVGGGASGINVAATAMGVNTTPTVSTTAVTVFTGTTATMAGNVTVQGCTAVTARGIVYGTSNNPVIGGNGVTQIPSGSGMGTFSENVTGLTGSTLYYARAYAINDGGPAYGSSVTFTTQCTTPVNATSFNPTLGNTQVALSWTNGSCSDEVLVVAKLGSAVTATPSGDGTAYTANAAFGSGTAIATGEFIVYKGSGTSITVTGLTNGTTYHFKVFTRRGTAWSSGVTASAVPALVYCTPTYTDDCTWGDGIEAFVLNGINNSGSGCGTNPEAYTNYPSTAFTTTLFRGLTYEASITNRNTYSGNIAVWIDFNNDGTFNTTERFRNTSLVGAGETIVFSIPVPADATIGQHRVRVREAINENDNLLILDPCANYGYGETEDYTITITDNVYPTVTTAAVPTPTATTAFVGGNVTSDAGSAVISRGVVYSLTANPAINGTGVTRINIGSGTGAFNTTITGLEDNKLYYVRAFAVNGNGTSYGEQISFTTLFISAPELHDATEVSYRNFLASWDAVAGAQYYKLDVSTSETFGTVTLIPNLIISEYIEGSSNNRSIEIYNGTGAAVNLSAYSLKRQFNGSGNFVDEVTLSGTLANGEVYVVSNASASATILAQTDQPINGNFPTFTGNDPVALYHGGNQIDVVGVVNSSANWGAEVTLIRKPSIVAPSTTYNANDWTQQSQDYFTDLGTHTYGGNIPIFVTGYDNLTVNGTSQVVTGLAQNTQYYYRVRAVGVNSTSANSVTEPVKTGLENIWTSTGWSAGVAPTAIDKATINYDYNTGAEGGFSALELEVLNGTLTIEEGDNLTITKQININNSTHVVAQGEQATYGAPLGETVIVGPKIVVENNAGLIQIDDTNNTGFIKVDRKSAPIFRLDYALWSSPVAGETLIGFSPKTLTNRFYKYNPLTDAYNNSMTSQGTIAFAEGESYLIRVANTHPAYVDETSTPERWEGSYVGTPFNGDVNVSVTPRTPGVISGFNAVGNPYPSPIKVAEFFSRNSGNLVNGSPIFLWRKKNDAGTSSYVQLTMAGLNVPNDNPNGNSSDGEYDVFAQNGEWVLNTGQGFIVQAQSSSIVFDNEMRFAKNHDFQFRTAQDETVTSSRLWLNLKNTLGESSPAMIAYTANTTLGLDYGWDGRAMTDGPVTLYSVVADSKLGIQARPSFEDTDEVPMSYEAEAAGTYTLSLDQFDGVFAQGQDIFVRDNVLGITHDLKGGAYEFASEAGTINGRFDVIYAQALNTGNPIWSEASVIVYKDGSNINISTGVADMTSVKIYDTRGRMLYSGDNINATETVISGLQAEKQVLIVTIATLKGEVSKKIIF